MLAKLPFGMSHYREGTGGRVGGALSCDSCKWAVHGSTTSTDAIHQQTCAILHRDTQSIMP